MLAPLLAAALAAAPAYLHRVTLLTQEQVEAAPVEDLTLKQLYAENARLDSPPTLGPSTVMIAAGGGAAIGFGLLSWLAITATSRSRGWDTLGWVFIDIITIAITAAGAIVAIIGAAMLPGRIYERDRYAQRQAEVRSRISALRSGQAQEPYVPELETPAAVTALTKLEDERPGLGLPIALMSSGAGVGLLGAYYWATARPTSSGSVSPVAIGLALICAGVVMEGFGIFSLILRINQRSEVDARIDELQRNGAQPVPPLPPPPMDAPPPLPPPPPPSVQLQTPAPVLFSYAWTF
jgi:hypothetical protein